MKINVLKIPENGLKLQFFREGDWFRDIVPEAEEQDFSLQKVACSCFVKRSQKAVVIEGRIETTIDQACSCCLEVTHLPVDSAFRYTFLPADDLIIEDRELKMEDLDSSYYQGEVIDLDPLLFEQIILQIPIRVLCSDSCKGLCPRCGTNLNWSDCGCRTDFIDERFASLKKLKL